MKKRTAVFISLVLAAALVTGGFTAVDRYEKKQSIALQSAVEIAYTDAKVTRSDVKKITAELEREGFHYVYDIEFSTDNHGFDYTINARNGEIISREIETKDDNPNVSVSENNRSQPTDTTEDFSGTESGQKENLNEEKNTAEVTADAGYISKEDAIKIAVKAAGADADSVRLVRNEFDTDDGKKVYEIEFVFNGKEYEYSIDASSGKIIENDTDDTKPKKNKPQVVTQASGTYISVENAKEIALNHSGLSAGDVRFVKVVMDKDDGIVQYEIEFTKGNVEYEYSINASTGKIIEFDKDVD